MTLAAWFEADAAVPGVYHWFGFTMGYYIRVLGTNLDDIPLGRLQEVAQPTLLNIVKGNDDAWEQLALSHKSGQEIAIVERNPVIGGQLGADELQEFIEEVAHHKPESAATWLQQYLPRIKVIYAFQLLDGTNVDDGWSPLHRLHNAIWNHAGGILQADGEGFSDEDGYTILWQFSDTVNGQWNMGVLESGRWDSFRNGLRK
jgi:hypothetical protein